MASSTELESVLEQLNLKKEQFNVLQEKFLEQRKELYDSKKTDSNKEYVTLLEGKLKKVMERNADLEKTMETDRVKAMEEMKKIQMKLDSETERRVELEDGIFWNMALIDAILQSTSIITGGDQQRKRMERNAEYFKQRVDPANLKPLSDKYFQEVEKILGRKDSELENVKKELMEAKDLADSYKKRAEESEEQLRFDLTLTKQVQERIHDITTSLEYHKKLVAELELEKEKTRRIEEEVAENQEEEQEDEEDEEDYEDEESGQGETDYESTDEN